MSKLVKPYENKTKARRLKLVCCMQDKTKRMPQCKTGIEDDDGADS